MVLESLPSPNLNIYGGSTTSLDMDAMSDTERYNSGKPGSGSSSKFHMRHCLQISVCLNVLALLLILSYVVISAASLGWLSKEFAHLESLLDGGRDGRFGNGCVAWRETQHCTPDGPREPSFDRGCHDVIDHNHAGYCECQGGLIVERVCQPTEVKFTCAQKCLAALQDFAEDTGRAVARVDTARAGSPALQARVPLATTKKPRAVYYLWAREGDVEEVMGFLHRFEWAVNRKLQYDYVVFDLDAWSPRGREMINEVVSTSVTVVKLEGDAGVFPHAHGHRLNKFSRSIGSAGAGVDMSRNARVMARFFSGPFASHPALAGMEYAWRLDHTSYYYCPVQYDPLQFMAAGRLRFGYMMEIGHRQAHAPSVGRVLGKYLRTHPSASEWGATDNAGAFECAFHHSSAIVDLGYLRSKEFGEMFKVFDDSHGFYMEFWSETMFLTLAAWTLLRAEEVVKFNDIPFGNRGVHNLDTSFGFCPNDSRMLPLNTHTICSGVSKLVNHHFPPTKAPPTDVPSTFL